MLRSGLTVKHVDVTELLDVARFAPEEAVVLNPSADAIGERHYSTLAARSLDSLRWPLTASHAAPSSRRTRWPGDPAFLHGEATVTDGQGRSLECHSGEALFVPAAVGGYRVRMAQARTRRRSRACGFPGRTRSRVACVGSVTRTFAG